MDVMYETRKRGRLKSRWRDQVMEDIRNMQIENLKIVAEQKDR